MSADLQWAIIRNNASSIVKRNGLVLSRDPLNVMNVHSFKYSGLANKQAVNVVAADSGVKVVSKTKAHSKPKKSTTTVAVGSHAGTRSVMKAAAGAAAGRPDLQNALKRRACAIIASQKPVTVVKKGKRSTRKNKA